jgi:hypothetical protein
VGGVHAGDAGADSDLHTARSLTLNVDTFAWEALEEESAQQGVPVEELVCFSILYYLADIDSGRIARRLPQPTAARELDSFSSVRHRRHGGSGREKSTRHGA